MSARSGFSVCLWCCCLREPVYYDFALASGMEQSYIDSYVRYYTSPGWLAFILLFTTLMGFLGCMVGSRLIRRHFQKAGVL